MNKIIRREDAVRTVKNACKKVMRECDHHYDEKIEDYVYDNVHDVDLILKVNKEAVNALKQLPATNDLISRQDIIHLIDEVWQSWYVNTLDRFRDELLERVAVMPSE